MNDIDSQLKCLVKNWLDWDENPETKKEIMQLQAVEDKNELKRLMSKRIQFGTAGLRARMGPGFSQLNDLVIIQTTQGVACVLKNEFSPDQISKGAVIGFDKRHNSERFAKLAAAVLLLSSIPVYLLKEYAPTPYVAYSVRNYKHVAGIMITASHNPKEDNGYKLYWSSGAQIVSPVDKMIQDQIEQNLEPFKSGPNKHDDPWSYDDVISSNEKTGKLLEIDETCSEDYQNELCRLKMPLFTAISDAIITYTAMHGVGYKFVRAAFEKMGLPSVVPVEEQCEPDPEFPTVKYPNPEEGKAALDLSIKTANEKGSSVILANDPDADRLAVAEKLSPGTWKVLSGNELGTLIGWWLLENHKARIDRNDEVAHLDGCYMLSSTVSSRILKTMAEVEGFRFEETLTGFKWMGNRADQLIKEGKTVLFAFEEAIGYMCGSTVLDKDGVSAAYVVAQLVHYLYASNSNLVQKLNEIYRKYGSHVTHNSYYFCYDSKVINSIFERIRNFESDEENIADKYPKFLNGIPLESFRDLTAGIDSSQPEYTPILPTSKSSQMITFYLSNGIVLTVRTSGTEPKIKFYSEFYDKSKKFDNKEDAQMFLKMHMKNIINFLIEPAKNGLIPAAGLE